MADIVIDLLERHAKVPDRETLLDDYVKRFAGKRLGDAVVPAPAPEESPTLEVADVLEEEPPAPAPEPALEPERTAFYEAVAEEPPVAAPEPEPERTAVYEAVPEPEAAPAEPESTPTTVMAAVTEEPRSETVAFEAVAEPPPSEDRSATVAFEAVTAPAAEPESPGVTVEEDDGRKKKGRKKRHR
jgi:hypothetical protein